MPESLRKIWWYILPLLLLGVLACFDSDLNFHNPFAPSDPEIEENVADSTVASTDSLSQIEQDSLMTSADGNNEDNEEDITKETPATKQWRLVIGSLRDRSRAERLIAESGAPQATIMYVEHLTTYRVVYDSYADVNSAQKGFTEIRDRYSDAWLVYF